MIEKEYINIDLDLKTQNEVFEYLSLQATELGITDSQKDIYEGLQEREKESTTGFGKGIAIPHTKNKAVKDPSILVVRSKNLIEWNSLDGNPINTAISLLVPDGNSNIHLKLLSKISRQMMHSEFTDVLKEGTKEEIFTTITNILDN